MMEFLSVNDTRAFVLQFWPDAIIFIEDISESYSTLISHIDYCRKISGFIGCYLFAMGL